MVVKFHNTHELPGMMGNLHSKLGLFLTKLTHPELAAIANIEFLRMYTFELRDEHAACFLTQFLGGNRDKFELIKTERTKEAYAAAFLEESSEYNYVASEDDAEGTIVAWDGTTLTVTSPISTTNRPRWDATMLQSMVEMLNRHMRVELSYQLV